MYEFLTKLLQPYLLLHVLTVLAVVQLWRRRQESRKRLLAVTLPLMGLTLLCTPAVAHLLLGTLEWQYPPLERRPTEAQAIVVLASALRYVDADGSRAELDEDSVARCLYAVELYRQGPACPVVVTGGKVDPEAPGPAVAQVMADFLQQLGVQPADLVVEDVSRTTYENAVESGKVLKERHLDNVLLVTDAVDMVRAVGCFRKQGVEVIPAACHYRATPFRPTVFTFLPSVNAARNSQRVWHEWLGVLWYWSRGRL